MGDNINNRRVQVLKNKEWIDICMLDLKIGDIFRMFEPDGEKEAVIWAGSSVFVTVGEPFTTDTGVNSVKSDIPENLSEILEGVK